MKQFFTGCIILFITGYLFGQNDLQTVATVRLTKTEPITVKQLKNEVDSIEKMTGRSLTVAERREVLDSMINQRLALQGAERDRISVSDAEVNQQMNEFRGQLSGQLGRAPSDSEFADAVKQQTGMDMPAFRDRYKRQLIMQKYLLDKKGDVFKALKPPTEAEVKAFYTKNSSEFVQPETVEFAALMVPYKTDSEKASARNDANKLLREINNSAMSFDEKVLQGRTPNMAYKSATGQLMPRNAPNMPDDFIETAFKLEQGKVSGLLDVSTGPLHGFFIIKVTGKYPQKILNMDDIILNVPPELQMQLQGRPLTVRMFIQANLTQKKQQDALAKAQEELVADLRKGQPPPYSINEQFLNY
ncbi:MAG: peptidyl-prolyl cis-trans isomerase [Spirochaetaceae bacterium]|jgi:parvulin-like peptidyl-prolyl isomerase|nr:peptidyl-prolyl cis-trans isomerase [Spirochaetaceae bacterium]